MQFKGTRWPLPDIARTLRVDAVVEGSVLRSPDRVQIMVQLVHAATDRLLWAQTYERSAREMVALPSIRRRCASKGVLSEGERGYPKAQ